MLQWSPQSKSLVTMISLFIMMSLVLTEPYRNYEISQYSKIQI